MSRQATISESEEERQLGLALRGDSSAQRWLYEAHAAYLYAVCSRYVADVADAQDVLQEAFIRVFASLAGFEWRGPGSLRSWMTRVVVNEALRHLRRPALPQSHDEPPDVADEPSPPLLGIPPEALHEMVRRLPDGYRTVLNLYVFENHSHREISRLLGITAATSASQLHRAKRMLRRMIEEYRRGGHKLNPT